jgi:hypothetical protein
VEIVQSTVISVDTVSVSCPIDHPYALGGGYEGPDGEGAVYSRPTFGTNNVPNGWTVEGQGIGSGLAWTAYAICSK